ncbi:Chitinase A1 precursor [compost metagenome]
MILKKVILLMALFILALPMSVFAASPTDVLRGQLFISPNKKVGNLQYMTDNNTSTVTYWGANETVYYEFPDPINMTSGSVISLTASYTTPIVLKDINGTVLYSVNASNGTYPLPAKNGVKRIEIQGKYLSDYGGTSISDFKVFSVPPNPDAAKFVINNLNNVITNSSSISLSWDEISSEYFKSYNVYKDGEFVSSVTTNSFIFTGLEMSKTYVFKVTPVDTDNKEYSGASLSVLMPEPDLVPPSKPVGLTSIPDVYTSILKWTLGTETDLAGYEIYVDSKRVNGSLVMTNSYTLNGLKPETEYSYYIVAVDASGNRSPLSNSVTFKTLAISLPPESAPVLTGVVGNGSASLSWSPVKYAESYNVYQDDEKIIETDATRLNLKKLTNGQNYEFYVTAENAQGVSPNSNVLAVTPSDKFVPDISLGYSLKDVATGVTSWFSSYWLILAFCIAIPLSFYIANRMKGLFSN